MPLLLLLFLCVLNACPLHSGRTRASGIWGQYIFNTPTPPPTPLSEGLLETLERHIWFSVKTRCAFLRFPGGFLAWYPGPCTHSVSFGLLQSRELPGAKPGSSPGWGGEAFGTLPLRVAGCEPVLHVPRDTSPKGTAQDPKRIGSGLQGLVIGSPAMHCGPRLTPVGHGRSDSVARLAGAKLDTAGLALWLRLSKIQAHLIRLLLRTAVKQMLSDGAKTTALPFL